MSRTSVLGGEATGRGTFSGRRSRGVTIARYGAGVAFLLLLVLLQFPGLVIGVILLAVVFGTTGDLGGGNSIHSWVQDKRRWRYRVRTGFVDFIPVDRRPDDLTPDGNRREWNKYRDWPDGVDNLYWLESRPGTPAIAYHAGAGETAYCSMVFSVNGPIQGLHGDAYVAQASEAFGNLMAGWGASQALVSGIQIVTRVIPADSAAHEVWLQGQLDPTAPMDLQADYALLLNSLTASSFVQRHYAVVQWDVDDAFRAAAEQRMPGLPGWLDLVSGQRESVQRRLEEAMYKNVHALSGPQLAAVLRHLQHPDWSIDRASDVDVTNCWLPSTDRKTHTVVTEEYPDPMDPDWLMPPRSWLHRTAQIPADGLEVREIDGLWLSPLLTGMAKPMIRTISTHIRFTPAREAKAEARKDVTTDQRDMIARDRKGQIADDETEEALSSASRRVSDLSNGAGHHGAHWTAFLTVSALTPKELGSNCALIEEAADSCGINRLDWLDTIHSGAQACTWPVGRGMSAAPKTLTARTLRKVSNATAKETITE